MVENKCTLCGRTVPRMSGIYLGGKLYCNQRHAEKGFIGLTYCERNRIYTDQGDDNYGTY